MCLSQPKSALGKTGPRLISVAPILEHKCHPQLWDKMEFLLGKYKKLLYI